VNDVVLAGVGGALGALAARRGEHVEEIVASVPISSRSGTAPVPRVRGERHSRTVGVHHALHHHRDRRLAGQAATDRPPLERRAATSSRPRSGRTPRPRRARL
jgi:hypothetical protein